MRMSDQTTRKDWVGDGKESSTGYEIRDEQKTKQIDREGMLALMGKQYTDRSVWDANANSNHIMRGSK